MEKKVVRYRYNALDLHSLEAFAGVRGGINKDCKDVYFLRALAFPGDFAYEISQMDAALEQSMAEGRTFYKKIEKLPPLAGSDLTAQYTSYHAQWEASGRREARTKITAADTQAAQALGLACKNTVDIYRQNRPDANTSMEKNLVVKLLYWADQAFGGGLPAHQGGKRAVKIVGVDAVKEQEYLFYYMLTQMGADVLLLQQKKDLESSGTLMALSQAFTPQKTPRKDKRPAPIRQPKMRTADVSRPSAPTRQPKARAESDISPRPRLRADRIDPPAPRRGEKSFEELARLAASVVMIEVRDADGEALGAGSGIMIGTGGYILTNHHVASHGSRYAVRIEEDTQVYETDEVIKYNPQLDLAIIRIERTLKPLPICPGKEPLARGQKVVAIGSPLGLFNSVSDGIISGFRKIGDTDMIQFTAPISHGSSGGALLNMYGEVIGICTAGMDQGQNLNLAVRYEWIRTFARGFL